MNKKPILIAFLITLFSSTALADDVDIKQPFMNPAQYVAGGVLGSVVGFGFGHAIQGRYLPFGVIYTITEPLVGLMTVSAFAASFGASFGYGLADLGGNLSENENQAYRARIISAYVFLSVSLLTLVGIRIYEIFDLWAMPPIHNQIISQAPEKSVAIFPVLLPNYAGLSVQF